jgi:hypothetical protein
MEVLKVTKGVFLFILLVISSGLSAQHSLQSGLNFPRPDDEITKQQVEYKQPGQSGENVVWNFGQLISVADGYTLDYFSVGDTAVVGIEHHTRYYYSLDGDSLLCHGYENSTTQMINERAEVLLRFPVQYGDSIFGYYNGNGAYCDRLAIGAMGTVFSKADAYGRMIIPGGDTLNHVLRVHTVKKIASSSAPLVFYGEDEPETFVTNDSIDYRLANDTVMLEVETYRWYVEGYRYPVFETVKSIMDKQGQEQEYFATAFFYPPQEHYYLETDPENQAIIEAQNNKVEASPLLATTFNAFPNPATSTLNVEIVLPIEATIRIQVRSVAGEVLYINQDKGKCATGSHSFTLDVASLPLGYYLLNVWADDYSFSDTILKQ